MLIRKIGEVREEEPGRYTLPGSSSWWFVLFVLDQLVNYGAGKFLDEWCTQVMRSKLEPMKKVAKTIRAHKKLLLNWFEAKNVISLCAVEGQNNKAKVVIRKSYGFKTAEMLKIALYHKLGKLPVPDIAHRYF